MNILSYLNLITSEHRGQPNYIDMLTEVFTPVVDVSNLANSFVDEMDLDKAVGKQLDIIGEYVGQSREIGITLSTGSSILDDENYRFLLKAKIAQNGWDGTVEGLYSIWNELFGEAQFLIRDNQNMSVTFEIVPLALSQIQQELVLYDFVIPKPVGVKYNYTFLTKIFFAYDLDTDYYKGYDEGYWDANPLE